MMMPALFFMVSEGFPHDTDATQSLRNEQKKLAENQLYIEQQMADTNRPLC